MLTILSLTIVISSYVCLQFLKIYCQPSLLGWCFQREKWGTWSSRSSFTIKIERALSVATYAESPFFFKIPLKVLSSLMVTKAGEKWPDISTLKEASFYCLKASPLPPPIPALHSDVGGGGQKIQEEIGFGSIHRLRCVYTLFYKSKNHLFF